jgi:hypothetical protein
MMMPAASRSPASGGGEDDDGMASPVQLQDSFSCSDLGWRCLHLIAPRIGGWWPAGQ